MHSTEQEFFQQQARKFCVVLLLHVGDCRQDAMRLRAKPNVDGFKGLAHTRGSCGALGLLKQVRTKVGAVDLSAGLLLELDGAFGRKHKQAEEKLGYRARMAIDLFGELLLGELVFLEVRGQVHAAQNSTTSSLSQYQLYFWRFAMQLAANNCPVTMPRMGKREQRWNDPEAHRVLRKLYDEKVAETGMTQEQFGATYGIGNQSMVWQYLSGKVPLSLEAAARFARGLGCTIYDISPMLADQLKAEILPVLGSRSWWKGTGKALALAFAAVLLLQPAPPAGASFSSHVAGIVYYVKSHFRLWMVRFLTGFRKRRKLTFAE